MEYINALDKKITANEAMVKVKLCEACELVKNKIREEVKNKPLALILDIATKHNRSILGINVRYYTGSAFVIRTIGMQLLTKSHTAQEIYTEFIKTLDDFGIRTIQIIAYSTDNAGNVVNVVNWLNRDYDDFQMNHSFNLDDNIFASMNNDIFGRLIDDISTILDNQQIIHIPCAAHTEQLSVNDALKEPEFSELIVSVQQKSETGSYGS